MAGFLSLYSGTETIKIRDEYWVKVRECVDQIDLEASQQALLGDRLHSEQIGQADITTKIDINPSAHQYEIVARAVADWNLTDDDGAKLPLEPVSSKMGKDARKAAVEVTRLSLERLPAPVFVQIYTRVNELNSPEDASKEAQKQLRLMGEIRQGKARTPSLVQFARREKFWTRLGLRLEDLERMPYKEVEDYETIIELMAREEKAEANRRR